MADPYPKSQQLARGERRYRRKVASPKQWQAIESAKVRGRRCQICRTSGATDPHHLVARDHFGDDVPDNIIGLCRPCHDAIHTRLTGHRDYQTLVRLLLRGLTDGEYAYMVTRGGENYAERVYGITYTR